MRGSPLLRALVAFVCLLALGFPIWKLTGTGVELPVPVSKQAEQPQQPPVRLRLNFTAVPSKVKVMHLGQAVWNVSSPAEEVEKEFKIEYPKEGVDLEFEIEWPGETLSAMRAVLTDPEGTEHEKSVWGRGSVSEVLTFP